MFRANPDQKAEAVLKKIFMWLCEKGWEETIIVQDNRVIRREGMANDGFRGMERVSEKESEFSQFFEDDDDEKVGPFFLNS